MKKSLLLALASVLTATIYVPTALAYTTKLHPEVTQSKALAATGKRPAAPLEVHSKQPTTKMTGTAPASTLTYRVQGGDTLWKISQLSGISIEELQANNPTVNPDALWIGEPIQIPAVKAAAVIATAKQYLGKVHYVYGGTTPAGFDCSGFVQYMFAKNGVTLPRTVKQMALMGTPVAKNHLQKGDLIFFAGTNGSEPGLTHIGIYVANGWFIEQSSDYNNVIMARLWGNPFYRDHFAEARRLTSIVH